jgi:hypothetical protein
MSFDCSRFPFNPTNDYLGVVMQQGRVQLDSDWNEWQAEFARRIQAGAVDVFGRAAYPVSTPFAFKINVTANNGLTIGAGRMYVDGLLAENHGSLPSAFTVVAVGGLADPGAYGVQITPGEDAGQFNLSLYQATGGAPTQVGSLSNQTMASVQDSVSSDPTLSQYIGIQDVSATGMPASLTAPNALYMLAPSGPNFVVTVPSTSTVSWDPALAELSGAPFVAGAPEVDVDYTQQPYLPGADAPGAGPYLVYLDVWVRGVTSLERPELVEPAVGVDTTGRLQTVWQVKLLDLSDATVPAGGWTCSTPDSALPAEWANLSLPPAGSLSTGVVQSAPDGPCALTPNTGYTGMENQLYRVEIHQPGSLVASGSPLPVGAAPAGAATFKWSRDNASVATAVSGITPVHNASGAAVSQLTVQSLGRDQILGFNNGDWIEVTDDYLELNPPGGQGPTGELHQIDSVSAPDRTITLMDSLAGNFPAPNGLADPGRHTRIRRWDQQGKVYLSDGATVYFDLGAASSGGAIPVPPPGTTLVLENGVTVTFGQAAQGQFNAGDYWNFAARTADGTVEMLNEAPPAGIHHHYARLAMVTFPDAPLDCRNPWPPSSETCGCTVTVQPSDLTANNSLQNICDRYLGQATDVVICLMPGTYVMPQPLYLNARHSGLTLSACQAGTAVMLAQDGANFFDGMIVLDGVSDVTLSGLAFSLPLAEAAPSVFAGLQLSALDPDVSALASRVAASIGVRLVSTSGVTIEDCVFNYPNAAPSFAAVEVNAQAFPLGIGIFASGEHTGLDVENNEFAAVAGGGFCAGFLLAPSVAFIPAPAPAPAPIPIPLPRPLPRPIPLPVHLQPVAERASQIVEEKRSALAKAPAKAHAKAPVKASAKAHAKPHEKAKAPAKGKQHPKGKGGPRSMAAAVPRAPSIIKKGPTKATRASAVFTSVTAGQEDLAVAGLQNLATFQRAINPGIFQNILNTGTSTPTLAAQGGDVILAGLADSVFTGNSFSGMTIAVIVVGGSEKVEFAGNEVDGGCIAGFWVLSPWQALNLLLDPQNIALLGITVAMSYPLPSGDTTAPVRVAAAPAAIRLYAGTPAQFTDSLGNVWMSDSTSSPAFTLSPGSGNYTVPNVTGGPPSTITLQNGQPEPDPTLYLSERNGTSFSYTFPNLPMGYYQVTLKFAEIFYTNNTSNKGVRIFDVSINGTQVLTNFDIASDAPNADVADDKVYPNILPNAENQIVVQFTGTGAGVAGRDANAKVSAVALVPQWNGVEALNFTQTGELATFFVQLAQLAEQAYLPAVQSPPGTAAAVVPKLRLRVTDNKMAGLSSSALLVLGSDDVFNANASSLLMSGNQLGTAINAANAPSQSFFLCGAAIAQVSDCVVSSNMVANKGTSQLCLSFYLDDTAVATPGMAIMGNLFDNCVMIAPERYAAASQVPAPMNSWSFLNTIINCRPLFFFGGFRTIATQRNLIPVIRQFV